MPPLAVFRELFSYLYPCVCELCGTRVEHGALCADCIATFKRPQAPYCLICGESFLDLPPGGVCRSCMQQPPAFRSARAVFVNTGPVRELLAAFKYAGALHLAPGFAALMAQAVQNNPHWFDNQTQLTLVPVPMHRKKRLRRGYNQARELAHYLGKILHLPVADLLCRTPDTAAQAGMAREQRLRHARKIYTLNRRNLHRHNPQGKNIVLIDDILTTGATGNACAALLMRAGVRAVYVLTFARTQRLL